jgi:hypothetical protein
MAEITFPAAVLTALVKPLAGPNFVPLRNRQDICEDLRAIRFDDEGVLSIVRQILEGEDISSDDMQIVRDFADAEWRVEMALRRLVEDVRSVSRLTQQRLREIEYGKANVRRSLSRLLFPYQAPEQEIDIAALQQAYANILDLNENIDRIEDKLLHGNR